MTYHLTNRPAFATQMILPNLASQLVCYSSLGDLVPDPCRPLAVLPGSFNPLHSGHRTLAEVASRRIGAEVHFELSYSNVDKHELAADEVARRVGQFKGIASIWVTRAARFVEKAELFPGTAFILGYDTAIRLIDPRYYGGETERDLALDRLLTLQCQVLVGGRLDTSGVFQVWHERQIHLPNRFTELFETLSESEFRVDVSSTEIRSNQLQDRGV